jgi:chemotaxis protein CheD
MFAAKILPGELYVTTQNEIIVTVLGSCVSACVRDPVFGIGGMNHFMLPLQGGDGSWEKKGLGLATRYGNYAMEHLLNEILKNGGMRKNLEIKVFGGGKILAQMTDIGDKNIQFVLEYIKTEGLKLLSHDLGDIYPRKVQYHPKRGKVRIKKLRSLHNDTITAREREYMRAISSTQQEGEIDLF